MDEFRSYLQGQQDWIECNINRGFAKMEMMKPGYAWERSRKAGQGWCFSYNTTSSEDDLSFDVIMCTIGARYNHYCSNITRTYFINPTAFQEKCYRTLLKLYDYVILELKPGRTLGEVYSREEF